MIDARLVAPTPKPVAISTDTLTADQVENGWARDRAALLQCGADKAAIVGGYRDLRAQLADVK